MRAGRDLVILVFVVAPIVAALTISGVSVFAGYHIGKHAQLNKDIHAVVEERCDQLNGKIITEYDEDCGDIYCVYDHDERNFTFNLKQTCEVAVKRFKK